MVSRKSFGLLVVVLTVLLLLDRGLAEERFLVIPKLSAEWRVDSNYYRRDRNEREVHTYIVRPGIDLGYKTAKSLVKLGYTADLYFYDEKDKENGVYPEDETKNFVGHTFEFNSRTKPFDQDRLTVGLDNSFYKTRNPSQTDVLSNRAVRQKYWINRFSPYIFYDFAPRFTAGGRYRRTDLRYDSRYGEDSTEQRGIFDLIYYMSRSASLNLNYQHWKMDYDKNTSDYTSNQIGLIARKQFNHVVSVEAGAGYHKRKFDDSSLKDIDTIPYHGSVRAEKGRSHIEFTAQKNFNNYYDGGDYYTAYRFMLEAGHLFIERIPAAIWGTYQRSDYEGVTPDGPNDGRNDDGYRLAGSLSYIVRDWLSFTGEAGYEKRDSNRDTYDYNNKYGLFRVNLAYDVGKRPR